MSTNCPPCVVPLAQVPVVPADRAVTHVRIARAITYDRCGSNLMLGGSWMEPGEETNWWSSREEDEVAEKDHWYGSVEEVYFVVEGQLRLDWGQGSYELRPHDCVYLAPGWRYHLVNVGSESAFFLYCMTPAQE